MKVNFGFRAYAAYPIALAPFVPDALTRALDGRATIAASAMHD